MSEQDTEKTIGAVLAEARARRGQDINAIALKLRIRADYLTALENDDFSELPAPAYTSGFLRNYAQYLSLDSTQIVQRFKDQKNRHEHIEQFPEIDSNVNHTRLYIGFGVTLGVLFLIAIGFYVDWRTRTPPATAQLTEEETMPTTSIAPPQNKNDAAKLSLNIPKSDAAPPPRKEINTLANASVIISAASVHPPTTQNAPLNVSIRARTRTWMRLENPQGQVIFSNIIRPGQSYELPDFEYYLIETRNAGALEYTLNGQTNGYVGSNGQILSRYKIIRKTLITKAQ